jgi:mRNA interferase MazF
MIDKITTVPRANLGNRIGALAEADMLRINRALVLFLGIG